MILGQAPRGTNPTSETYIDFVIQNSNGKVWLLTIDEPSQEIYEGAINSDNYNFVQTCGPLPIGSYTATLEVFDDGTHSDPVVTQYTQNFEIWEHASEIGVGQGVAPENVKFSLHITESNGKYWYIVLINLNNYEDPADDEFITWYSSSDFPGIGDINSIDWFKEVSIGLTEGVYAANLHISPDSNFNNSNFKARVDFLVNSGGNVTPGNGNVTPYPDLAIQINQNYGDTPDDPKQVLEILWFSGEIEP